MTKGQGSRVRGQGYRQLLAWQRAHALALALFRATEPLSRGNGWLRSQCNRSAVSVAANIAEGYSRGTLREYLQFLSIARASLAETEYYVIFMRDAGLLTRSTADELDALRVEAANLLLGLIRSLQAKDPQYRPGRRIGEELPKYLAAGTPAPGSLTHDP